MDAGSISDGNIKVVTVDESNIENFKGEFIYEPNCFVEIRIKKFYLRHFLHSEINQYSLADTILTPREIQILEYLADGLNNYQISKLLNISVHTTKAHIHNIFEKLSVQDRTKAVVKAIKHRLINI